MKNPTAESGASHPFTTFLIRTFLAACILISAFPASARPRPPWPLLPEFAAPLFAETFDQAFVWNTTNAQVTAGPYTLVESWSGYALQRRGGSVTPFGVPGMDATGRASLTGDQGTIRFWFQPAWSSTSPAGGSGPGNLAVLLELDALGKGESATAWTLIVNPDGTTLSLVGQSDSQPTLLLQTEISWLAGQSHLLALDYGPKETALFLDGQLVAQGAGTRAVPPQWAALFVGSSLAGKSVAEGEFDELFCFGRLPAARYFRPMTPADIWFYYTVYAAQAALGPISAAEIAAREKLVADRKAQRAASASALSVDGGGMEAMAMRGSYGALSDCVTNVPVCMTNVWAGFETDGTLTVTVDVVGGTNGLVYDVFGTTNLAGGSMTNMPWVWVTNTPTCSTVVMTNQPLTQMFYILAGPLDTDGDGLTDAYELLVSHTDPNNPDSDGDGISDGWAVYLGLNPNGNDPGNSSSRANFSYTLADWLNGVSGVKSGSVSTDGEGNVTSVSQ